MRRGGLSRRQVLQGGGIAVVGAGGLTLAGLAGTTAGELAKAGSQRRAAVDASGHVLAQSATVRLEAERA